MTGQFLNAAGTTMAYTGAALAVGGIVCMAWPTRRVRRGTRVRAAVLGAGGAAVLFSGLSLPTPETSVSRQGSGLDQIIPTWQFAEFHDIVIDAPGSRVYEAITQVRADEVFLYRTLTWIRRGGRPAPTSILNPGGREPLLQGAARGGFLKLIDAPPRELVIGTVVVAPPGTRVPHEPEFYRKSLRPGFAIAVMNFLVRANGPNRSVLSTETRVFASDAASRRRFAPYWRVIYPGSALIRRMWLRAIARRAARPSQR